VKGTGGVNFVVLSKLVIKIINIKGKSKDKRAGFL